MDGYKKLAFTPAIEAILQENDRRLSEIFGTHDQVSGRGMKGHTHEVTIPDYPIKTQWLTDEVYNNGLYQAVIKAGSVGAYVQEFNNTLEEGDISDTDVVNELFKARASRDPAFAFATLFKIKSKKDGHMVYFMLNHPQRYLLDILEEMRQAHLPIRIILLKARQWGGSTLVQLYMAWIQLFVLEGWYSVIIAQTKDTAKRIKAMYKKVLDNMPGFLFDTEVLQFSPYEKSSSDSVVTDNSGHTVRDNVVTVASYENFESTRGMDYAMAHFSEVAYWRTTEGKSAEEVITNIDSNILELPLTMEISESTAKGMAGYFYDEYQMAKEGTSARKAVFIPFFLIENDMLEFENMKEKRLFVLNLLENQANNTPANNNCESGEYLYGLWKKGATLEHIKWYIKKRASFHDHAQMASEAPSDDIECFKYSGNRVFNIYAIESAREKYVKMPLFVGDIVRSNNGSVSLKKSANGLLKIWKQPDNTITENEYMVVVDVGGRSQNSDFSCITVINRWPLRFKGGKMEVVARWHGHIRYDWLAYKAVNMATYYKNAIVVFESNTFDKKKAEASEFVEQGDHIRGILRKVQDDYPNLYMRTATDPEDIKNGIYKKIGFQTNKKTKQDMVDNFMVVFEDDGFIDPDAKAYDEMAKYEQRPDGSYGNIPGRGNHDDILMTDMIGCLVSDELPLPSLVDNSSYQSLDDHTRNESDL